MNQRGSAPILGVIIVLTVLSGLIVGGFLFFKDRGVEPLTQDKDGAEQWKTFDSETAGYKNAKFTVEYPIDWYVQTGHVERSSRTTFFDYNPQEYLRNIPGGQEVVPPAERCSVKITVAVYSVNGIVGIYRNGENTHQQPDECNKIIRKIFDSVYEKKYTVSGAIWKTYRNENLGFEINYPENWLYLKSQSGTLKDFPARGAARNKSVAWSGIYLYPAELKQSDGKECMHPETGRLVDCLSLSTFNIQILRFNKNFNDTVSTVKTSGLDVQETALAGVSGISVDFGLEGEGNVIYYLPMKNQTLKVVFHYNRNGDGRSGMPLFNDQQKIFDEIVKTLKLL